MNERVGAVAHISWWKRMFEKYPPATTVLEMYLAEGIIKPQRGYNQQDL